METLRYSIYDFSDLMERLASHVDASRRSADYGTGTVYTAAEAHTVSYIGAHPGCTVKEIAYDWGKTSAAVSHIIKRLRAEELIYSKADPSDMKKGLLHLTQKGETLDQLHRNYDTQQWKETFDQFAENHGSKEVNLFLDILTEICGKPWQ